MPRICVTGAAGKAGRAVVADLLAHGHDVVATDLVPYELAVPVLRADLTDFGQTAEVLYGCDAVVHLANIPAPGIRPPAVTYADNTVMNANVFLAAAQQNLSRVVWASSETTLGLPFDEPPRYAPVDEAHYPLPTSTYALSKVVGETTAEHVSAWSGIPFVALRLSNIFEPHDYARVESFWADPSSRKWNLWGYIDVRDVAPACRLSLTADVSGAESFVIAAADTIMDRPSADLMRETFPGVPVPADLGEFATLLSIDKARRVLGFEPRHSWRQEFMPATPATG